MKKEKEKRGIYRCEGEVLYAHPLQVGEVIEYPRQLFLLLLLFLTPHSLLSKGILGGFLDLTALHSKVWC
jgi:hypothetical protein